MLSTAGGQASLRTLLQAPDFSSATFLLSVLGEGTFVNLLNFLCEHGPDPVTRQICRLAARDEARHVAFGMAHLKYRLSVEPDYLARLQNAVEQRHEDLAPTSGLNEEVFDALVLIAAGLNHASCDGTRPRGRSTTEARHGRGPQIPVATPGIPGRSGATPRGPAHPQLHVRRRAAHALIALAQAYAIGNQIRHTTAPKIARPVTPNGRMNELTQAELTSPKRYTTVSMTFFALYLLS